jgi:hypothetical protein
MTNETVPIVERRASFAPLGSLTGRIRYRQSMFGKLILQVEFHDSSWLGHSVHRFLDWRDATVSDIYAGAYYGNMPSEIVRDAKWPNAQANEVSA